MDFKGTDKVAMGSKGISLYATRTDYEPVLRAVEARHQIKYTLIGLLETPVLTVYYSGLDIPDLGIASWGVAVGEKAYLVAEAATEIHLREIRQRKGGIRFAIESSDYEKGIIFTPGGLYEDRCLTAGEIGTTSDNPAVIAIYRLFVREIKKQFVRVRASWLGPEALRLFDSGMRLTADVRSPVEYSLKRNQGNSYW